MLRLISTPRQAALSSFVLMVELAAPTTATKLGALLTVLTYCGSWLMVEFQYHRCFTIVFLVDVLGVLIINQREI